MDIRSTFVHHLINENGPFNHIWGVFLLDPPRIPPPAPAGAATPPCDRHRQDGGGGGGSSAAIVSARARRGPASFRGGHAAGASYHRRAYRGATMGNALDEVEEPRGARRAAAGAAGQRS